MKTTFPHSVGTDPPTPALSYHENHCVHTFCVSDIIPGCLSGSSVLQHVRFMSSLGESSDGHLAVSTLPMTNNADGTWVHQCLLGAPVLHQFSHPVASCFHLHACFLSSDQLSGYCYPINLLAPMKFRVGTLPYVLPLFCWVWFG